MCQARVETTGRPAVWLLRVLVTILLLIVLLGSFAAATVTTQHAKPAGSPGVPAPTPTAASTRFGYAAGPQPPARSRPIHSTPIRPMPPAPPAMAAPPLHL